jgi:4'-phosphopantetheinyl transferase
MDAEIIDIWLIRADIPEPDIAYLSTLLDEEENAKAKGFQRDLDRSRYIVAHGLTRCIVGGRLGAPAREIEWQRGVNGKPGLTGAWHGIQVNLSHSGEFCMVAIAESRPVGIDIQQIVPGIDVAAMAGRYFPPGEAEFVASAAEPAARAERFARLWARKEAIVKAGGGTLIPGLRIPVQGGRQVVASYQPKGSPEPYLHRVMDLPAPQGFRAAVALSGPEPFQVRSREFSMTAVQR